MTSFLGAVRCVDILSMLRDYEWVCGHDLSSNFAKFSSRFSSKFHFRNKVTSLVNQL